MKVKCEYCAAMIDSTLDKCPNCGAVNSNVVRVSKSTPRTIAELKEWYVGHNLPPSNVTRFFIGEDYKEPRAFGIYQDGNEFVVYKNKDTGERAIRYRGTDEAYAVNELYLKLKSEILNQKANSSNRKRKGHSKARKIANIFEIGFFLAIVLFMIFGAIADKISRIPHYYSYDDTVYVTYNNSWYEYNDYSKDYYPVTYVPDSLYNQPADYEYNYKDYEWDTGSTFVQFKDSDYYEEVIEPTLQSNNDSDSYSWDSGSDSWDSGGTDWGSDW